MTDKMKSVSHDEYVVMRSLALRQTELKAKAFDAARLCDSVKAQHDGMLDQLRAIYEEINKTVGDLDAMYRECVIERHGVDGVCRIDDVEVDGQHAIIVEEAPKEEVVAEDAKVSE